MMVHAAMLKRTYDWCIDAADKPYALWILAAVAFAESSFFPIPPDIMLLPMSLARPKRAWWFATVCTIASVAGGLLGYAIGALARRSDVDAVVVDRRGPRGHVGEHQQGGGARSTEQDAGNSGRDRQGRDDAAGDERVAPERATRCDAQREQQPGRQVQKS